ncbi:GNAT family N-acetyltransferase [Elioraea sp.]|uniref:GNAT family N-acetyltransferase n=1 Tax=Elioraea sp. TaxID=2185103 RepID=UPI0025BA2950|nr:GNAT family N-acetyltransferase [Elioraea sp.]
MSANTVVPVAPEHRPAWGRLYAGYAAFYKVEQTEAMRDTVWGWLMDPAHEVNGLVALGASGEPVGLAHYRPYARPLRGGYGGFLDDLFVDPAQRGQRIADTLIEAVAALGREKGWGVIRWITADDNYRGRGVYDRLATRTMWITYDKML